MKSGAERLAELRARRRKEGLKPREIWVSDTEWRQVQRYLERLAKRRNAK